MQDQSENISDQEHENLAEDAMDSLGEPEGSAEEILADKKPPADDLPAFAKERLGRQEKRHKRELRELRQQIQMMQSSLTPQNYGSPQSQPDQQGGDMQDHISRAVQAALQAKEDQQRKMEEAEKAAHVHQQYQNLEEQMDSAADKYEDFDDVVRNPNVPFTSAMRDTALLIDNPGDVLYKLGKNRAELKRIAQLHPLDQAKEMVKLSIALMGGNNKGGTSVKPLNPIRNNPVTSFDVTDQTSPADIRARMKAGTWK